MPLVQNRPFASTYNYVAQLLELGDAELENFAAFAKLFSKRLKGISPKQMYEDGISNTPGY